ncbi:helix-turn-helix transcriptional regulator [Motilibacter deserti]|uniref:Helix-turn-helix domain-containing protein n=1 Tax=Motilibacter deserti TaxID=2714956 RepID=A0ABX0GNU8_9ACTN|nr:helix-turn-helix transcriptional regulator [Motilibacter deserti]NHC12397.1 helix-turn-helix domain-containing protein [Motilibacter deserti]
MDRPELADFLRRRRERLQPADVGIAPGPRRRTPGLRRDDVATLAAISTDYYTRLEQARGPHPSPQVLTALARALRLTDDERDHLFHLAGQQPPRTGTTRHHVRPALLHVLDSLRDTPAFVITDLAETLVQNRLATVLLGDETRHKSQAYRWFLLPGAREIYPEEDHARHSRVIVSDLRATAARRSNDPDVTELVDTLLAGSAEFRELWEQHEVGVRRFDTKRIVHPLVGVVEVDCETLQSVESGQTLVVLTPRAGTPARDQLALLGVVGLQDLASAEPSAG